MKAVLEKLVRNDQIEKEIVEICSLCDGKESEFLFWNCDRLYHIPGKFGTYSCMGCGLIRLSPRPTVDSISVHYPEDYGAYVIPQFSTHTIREPKGFRSALRKSILAGLGYYKGNVSKLLRIVSPILSRLFLERATYGYGDSFPRFVQDGSALEIGCGNGTFLGYLKHHGWNVAGIDLSPYASTRAKELFDIDVFVGQLEDSPFPPESFDYVHMSHVVEHFFEPLESMRKVFGLLKPGGIVYVEVPSADSISADMSGVYWYGWDAPRHLFMFTPNTLKLTLKKAGFNILKMRTKMEDFFDWASTFKYEDESGTMLKVRPLITDDDTAMVPRQRSEAQRRFKAEPDRGDIISMWAVKPQ